MQKIVFFLFSCSLLFGGIEAYFKSAPNKSGDHAIRNIDFIYMINLDQRPEKFERCVQQLGFYGIEPYRFSAVNGWELSLEAINDLGVPFEPWMAGGMWATFYELPTEQHEVIQAIGRTYFCHCMAKGAIGIVLSHLSVLQDAYDSGYERIWVMEDDIDLIRDPHCISDLVDQLDQIVGKGEWDILFTDPDTKNGEGEYVPCSTFAWRPNFYPPQPERFSKRMEVGATFRRIGARFGAYSMIVQRSGMKKILDFIKAFKIFLPYDMDFTLPNDLRLYTLTYDVVSTQPNAISDNGLPFYLKAGMK